jgi:hypothetical protein
VRGSGNLECTREAGTMGIHFNLAFESLVLEWARTRPNINSTPQIVHRVPPRRIYSEAGPTFVCYTAQVKRPYCNTTNTAGSKSRIKLVHVHDMPYAMYDKFSQFSVSTLVVEAHFLLGCPFVEQSRPGT